MGHTHTETEITVDQGRIRRIAGCFGGLFVLYGLTVTWLMPKLLFLNQPRSMLVVGIVLLLVSIPFHLLGGRKRTGQRGWRRMWYGIVLIVNTGGMMFCQAAYYTHIQADAPETALMAGVVIPLALMLLLWGAVSIFPMRYAGLTLSGGLLAGACLIAALVFWIRNSGTRDAVFFSYLFFTLLGLLGLIIAQYAACEDDTDATCLRYVSFASFGILLIAAVIVFIILMCAAGDCDCDCGDGCCDGCDCPSGGSDKKAKRRK